MKIKPDIRFTARKAGGLFVGIRYQFACHVVEDCEAEKEEQHFLYRTLSFGLLVWTVEFVIITDYKPLTLSPPTQQELNVRFAKALGWKIEGDFLYSPNGYYVGQKGFAFAELENVLPNYFAPENFHLVRAAVERLTKQEFAQFYTQIKSKIPYTSAEAEIWKFRQMFLSPVEHIITAYLKVKEAN